MASCNWKKLKSAQEVKALFRHCCTDEREKNQHSNRELDKSLTHKNVMFGAFENYEKACEKYDKKIDELDSISAFKFHDKKSGKIKNSKANKRKDRVTAIALEFVVPPDMENEEQMVAWASEIYEHQQERLGDNLIGGALHFDEVHEYKDKESGEWLTSRPHMHLYFVPIKEIEDTDGIKHERLNAKEIQTKESMIEMNKYLEEVSQKYGFSYATGKNKKRHRTVEELKNESRVAEMEEQFMKSLEKREHELDMVHLERIQAIEERERELDERDSDLSEREIRISQQEKNLAEESEKVFQSLRIRLQEETQAQIKQIDRIIDSEMESINGKFFNYHKQRFEQKLQQEHEARVQAEKQANTYRGVAHGLANFIQVLSEKAPEGVRNYVNNAMNSTKESFRNTYKKATKWVKGKFNPAQELQGVELEPYEMIAHEVHEMSSASMDMDFIDMQVRGKANTQAIETARAKAHESIQKRSEGAQKRSESIIQDYSYLDDLYPSTTDDDYDFGF